MTQNAVGPEDGRAAPKTVKCVVWDLDNTVWDGVLLEDGPVPLRPGVRETIEELDRRGILHSVASRNDREAATEALRGHGLLDYFLVPQIGWGRKSASVRAIAESLNLGLDAFAFVDDDGFEREEVAFELPQVLCVDALEAADLPARAAFNPRFITEDSANRRLMYRADQVRQNVEDEFAGPQEAFLATLDMRLSISHAKEEDLKRGEELTVRTNQLNTTGYTYSYEELDAFRRSPDHELLVARLEDRYGPYGTIGLILLSLDGDVWTIKLLLMSCRVMSRGVGSIVITYLRRRAREANARLQAEYLPNGRNRMMFVTYKFSRFKEIGREGDLVRLEADLDSLQPYPDYVRLDLPEGE
ncbi:HAD-IIIC family phosphatase [Nocardiopsis sp. LOL_012]|uniref:HAD-IIIC family phosphatase n=1 Tax=Nocardiopsis sp. LOL_012 TaxID=3345409 RepID=UPI003A89A4D1